MNICYPAMTSISYAELSHLTRAMSAFGHEEEEGRNVIIAGGGNIGLTLAQEIQEDHVGVRKGL